MLSSEEIQAVVDLFPFLNENPVIVDGGSNKGSFSEIFIKEYKGRCQIHLFEPNKMLLDYSRIKFEYEKNITYNELGLSNKRGERNFFYFENYNNEISSIYPDELGGWNGLPMKECKIHTERIDEYCMNPFKPVLFIDYLKFDVEGSEVEAMYGCIDMLKADKIKIIQIEYGSHYVRAGKTFQEVIDLVTPLGYKVYKYAAGNFYELSDFKEDYHAENFYITKEEIHNYSADGEWMNPFALSVCDLPKFDLMLEVGAYEGITTRYMCNNMLNEGGRVIVVDPLMDVYIKGDTDHPYFKGQYQRFLRNTRGLPVELYRGDSDDELPKLSALKVDFGYIDGNHHYPYVYNDAINVFKMTKNDGYILFDDYDTWKEETKMGIDKFLSEYEKCVRIISKGYQLLIQKIIDP